MTEPAGFRLLEHTADMGLEAWGTSRREVYIQAAKALSVLIFGDRQGAAGAIHHNVGLDAGDSVELLVAWLGEIVYVCDVNDLVPSVFEINELDNQHLRGTIHGEAYDANRHAMERQVKAVTYHQAALTQRDNGWYARVFVDL